MKNRKPIIRPITISCTLEDLAIFRKLSKAGFLAHAWDILAASRTDAEQHQVERRFLSKSYCDELPGYRHIHKS